MTTEDDLQPIIDALRVIPGDNESQTVLINAAGQILQFAASLSKRMPLDEAFAEWAEESHALAQNYQPGGYDPEIAAILSKATMTVEEFGQVMGVGRRQAYQFVAEGGIKSLRIGKRIVVPTQPVRKFLEQGTP